MLSGRVPVCKWVRLACERNQRDLQHAESEDPAFPYRFSAEAASRICIAAEKLPHIKGPKAKVVGRDEEVRPVWACL